MPLTKAQIQSDMDAFATEYPAGQSTILIGSTTGAGHKGSVVNTDALNDEGLTDGYLFSLWVDPTVYAGEDLQPLKTKVTVDTVEYLLIDKVILSGGVQLRLDIKNLGK